MPNKAANETSQNEEIAYVIDAGSGWEQDDDLVWIIDEANEAAWENQVAFILD
ncbi:hypothetical protein P9250_19720 [Caballeronia sp. LP006]|uniref:hypothetical protein n=1 Tax=Caballeronia sp. LP006 TaxID=3038552 RepID=UPI00285A474A|nr:hypothetical protein [Caballeronia sp. LP006]MDR5830105.1 hypothetical protein [Caballeronia sp. LP006]